MKKNISFAVFATLLYCLPAEAGQPSLCQSGIATRQLCSNLDGIITGELQNISVLDKLNNKEIDSDKAINLILAAQKYIQSNYIDTISTILSGNLEQEDMRFARELNPRIVNVYRKCDLWVNQFQALKPETVSKVDYDNMTNYCKIEPQNLYDAYCKPMDEGKCADKGEKAGMNILNDFKRKNGGILCGRFQEIDSFVQKKLIDNPVCDCDDAFNNAVNAYIDKQVQQLMETCRKDSSVLSNDNIAPAKNSDDHQLDNISIEKNAKEEGYRMVTKTWNALSKKCSRADKLMTTINDMIDSTTKAIENKGTESTYGNYYISGLQERLNDIANQCGEECSKMGATTGRTSADMFCAISKAIGHAAISEVVISNISNMICGTPYIMSCESSFLNSVKRDCPNYASGADKFYQANKNGACAFPLE